MYKISVIVDIFPNTEIEDSHRDKKIGFIHVNSLSVEILKQSHVKASPFNEQQ